MTNTTAAHGPTRCDECGNTPTTLGAVHIVIHTDIHTAVRTDTRTDARTDMRIEIELGTGTDNDDNDTPQGRRVWSRASG